MGGLDGLARAAQLPHDIATAVTDEVAHQAEQVLSGLGHRNQPADPSQLQHESSLQFQHHHENVPSSDSRPQRSQAAAGSDASPTIPEQSGSQTAAQAEAKSRSRESEGSSSRAGSDLPSVMTAKLPSLREESAEERQSQSGASQAAAEDSLQHAGKLDGGLGQVAENTAGDWTPSQVAAAYTLQHAGQLFAKDDSDHSHAHSAKRNSSAHAAHGLQKDSDGYTSSQDRVPGDQIDAPSKRSSPGSDSAGSHSSSGLGDLAASDPRGFRHYKPRDVVLRLEYISAPQTKAALMFLWVVECVGIGLLVSEFVKKLTDGNGAFRNFSIPIVNLVFGGICWLALTACLVTYLLRTHKAHRLGKRWKPRRAKLAWLLFTELVVQWINVTFFLVPNIYWLAVPCDMFSQVIPACAIVRWTCWNTIFLILVIQAHNVQPFIKHDDGHNSIFKDWTALQSSKTNIWRPGILKHTHTLPPLRKGHYEGAVIDAPWVYHAPKLLVWCIMEAFVLADAIYYMARGRNAQALLDLRTR